MPYNVNDGELIPVYREFKGWKQDLTEVSSIDDLPKELELYIQYIESQLNVPITLVSVGPDRKQTLYRNKVVNV
jgi:adenylosuccinate synthase